jgi:hypothetical protein
MVMLFVQAPFDWNRKVYSGRREADLVMSSVSSGLPRLPCLLLPSLFVHAVREEPQDYRSCPEEADHCNVGEQTVSEWRIQEAQPTKTCKYRPRAQNPRQEGGPHNEVARQECIESEKHQCDCGAPVIYIEKEECQRLQLCRAEHTQIVRASQDEQGGNKKEAANSLDDATGEADERRKKREAPARRLKQVVKESCHSDLASHFDEVDCETPLKQGPVGQYIGRRSRGVAVYNKPPAHETLGEYPRQYGEEIKHTRNSGLQTRRRFCDPLRYYACAHSGSPIIPRDRSSS